MAVEAAPTDSALQDQNSMLDELMASMAELENPGRSFDYSLHDKNIRLCKQLGPEMGDMLETARDMLASAFPLGDGEDNLEARAGPADMLGQASGSSGFRRRRLATLRSSRWRPHKQLWTSTNGPRRTTLVRSSRSRGARPN